MKVTAITVVFALLLAHASAEAVAGDREVGSPSAALAQASELADRGAFEEAEETLVAALSTSGGQLSTEERYLWLYTLSALRARRGDGPGAVSSLVEALVQADVLSGSGEPGHRWTGLTTRLELSELLRSLGRGVDAEAMAWDALGLAVDSGEMEMVAPVLGSLLLAVQLQGPDDASLQNLLTEIDTELHRIDGYRLSLPPPPEPVLEMLERMSGELLARGEIARARLVFEGILAVDEARGADWRWVADLSAVAWLAIAEDDLGDARRALQRASLALGSSPAPVDVWANRCYLAAQEGRWHEALISCMAGIDTARAADDAARAAALTSTAAGLRVLMKQPGKAAALYEDAARSYVALNSPHLAQAERALAVAHLADARRLDEALRLLRSLDPDGEEGPVSPQLAEARQRLALEMLLASFETAEDEEVLKTLQSLGEYLFTTGRSADLLKLSLLYVDLALRSERSPDRLMTIDEALQAVVDLEENLGLAPQGWVASFARGRVHLHRGEQEQAVQAWLSALAAREESLLAEAATGGPYREWLGRSSKPFYLRPPLEVHFALLDLLIEGEEFEAALHLSERIRRLRRSLAWRAPAGA
ncbi:MAG: hypothetical protein VX498_00935, partial [Myxococcota bacterium]|nr:hypothetical protein [Myxococcota bacterium]